MLQTKKLCFLYAKWNFVVLAGGNTVKALVRDHLGNLEKWSQLELVAYQNGLS